MNVNLKVSGEDGRKWKRKKCGPPGRRALPSAKFQLKYELENQ